MSILKRIVSVLMVIIMLLSSAPMALFGGIELPFPSAEAAAESYVSGNYTYTLENGKATITYLSKGYGSDLEIPSAIDGYPVVALGDRFCSISSLNSLTIPDSVVKIGKEAFYNLSTSGYITIGSGVEEIGEGAFLKTESYGFKVTDGNKYFCSDSDGVLYSQDKKELVKYPAFKSSLQEYTVPSSVEIISDYAFRGAYRLYKLNLSKNLKYIGKYAFYGSSTEIDALPQGLLEIGERAFSYNSKNDSFTIPSTVTYIHPTAFSANSSLDYITVADGNENYSSLEGVLFNKTQTELITYPKFKGVTVISGEVYSSGPYTVPSTVEKIGDYAFSESYIVEVNVPSNVKTIGAYAFYNCEALETVTLAEGVETLGDSAFCFDVYGEQSLLTSLALPATLSAFGENAFPENCLLAVAEGNKNYSSDSYGVLFNADKTTLIKYPSLSEYTEYVMPSTVVTVQEHAFYSAENLTAVTLSDNLETIGNSAFCYCSSLKTVESKTGNVKTIGSNAFYRCELLENLCPLKNIETIGIFAFGYCYKLTEITLSASLEEIGSSAFNQCSTLKDVYYTSDANDWKHVIIGDWNDPLTKVTMHYDAHTHSFGDWRVYTEPTCTETGKDEKLCSYCGFKDYREVDMLGHSFTNYVRNNNATCNSLETETARCDRCPVKDTRSIAGTKLQHTYVTDEYVAPTCTETGLTEGEHCEECKTVFVKQEVIPVLGHSFTNYVSDGNMTCVVDGTKTAKCDRCNKTDTLPDENCVAPGHNVVAKDPVEPTCEEAGYIGGTHCSRCKTEFEPGEEVAALGHNEVTDKAVAPSCEENGFTEGSHCDRCGKVFTAPQKTEPTGHTEVVDSAVAAVCGKTGLTEGSHCGVCGKVLKEQIPTESLSHNYVTTTKKGTATADGKTETKCTLCGDVTSLTIYNKANRIALAKTSYTYDGKVKKPAVTVKTSAGKTLKSGTDYTVKYSNAKSKAIGSYSVTITFKGNYEGSKTVKYTIVPVGTSLSSLTAQNAGFTATWKKQTKNTTGYQIEYATNSSFKSSKTVTVTKNTTLSKALSGLKEKTKYYVRVRTYKTVNKTKYCSVWSAVKTVTTKPAIKVTLNSTALNLFVGDAKTLKATTYPTGVTVKWKSSNSAVVSVSSGKLKALKKGSATVTASFTYKGKTYKSSCKVTVSNPTVTLSKSKASLEAGQTLSLKVTVKPTGGTLKWATSNSKVATVNSKGKVTAKAMGTSTITASYTYKGKTYKKTCKITVTSLIQELKQGFTARLIVPSVGSPYNYYCGVKFSNNTDYNVTLSMHVYANGKGCSNSSASGYVVKSGAGASANFYRDLIPTQHGNTRDMYLDNYSTAWTIIDVNGKKVYVKFDTKGNTRFGYSAAEIDEY